MRIQRRHCPIIFFDYKPGFTSLRWASSLFFLLHQFVKVRRKTSLYLIRFLHRLCLNDEVKWTPHISLFRRSFTNKEKTHILSVYWYLGHEEQHDALPNVCLPLSNQKTIFLISQPVCARIISFFTTEKPAVRRRIKCRLTIRIWQDRFLMFESLFILSICLILYNICHKI